MSTYGLPLSFDEVDQNNLQVMKIATSLTANWTFQHTNVLVICWKRCCSEHSLAAARWSQPLHAGVLEGAWEQSMKAEDKEPGKLF